MTLITGDFFHISITSRTGHKIRGPWSWNTFLSAMLDDAEVLHSRIWGSTSRTEKPEAIHHSCAVYSVQKCFFKKRLLKCTNKQIWTFYKGLGLNILIIAWQNNKLPSFIVMKTDMTVWSEGADHLQLHRTLTSSLNKTGSQMWGEKSTISGETWTLILQHRLETICISLARSELGSGIPGLIQLLK